MGWRRTSTKMAKSNYNFRAQESEYHCENYGGINLLNSGCRSYINIIKNK
jgi:hypothetical protein